MKIRKLLLLTFLICLIQNISFSQNINLYAGIEVGSKGIKISVIEITNIKRGEFDIKSYWAENVGIAKGIAIDGNLIKEDIDKAALVVSTNYARIKSEFNVTENNIFIVGSSGVAMAKNTQELIEKVKLATNKDMEFIDASTEGRMLLKGCVPPNEYKNSMVLDIGGGNTKGGYVDVKNEDNNFVFFPLSLNYGTITLTEAVNKKVKNETVSEFNEKCFGFMPNIREQIGGMYASAPVALEKERVYLSGGTVWAFYTLYNGAGKETFNEFKLEDVLNYDAILKNNFVKFEELAKTNKDAEKVLKTYSQKYLISGSNILLASLEALPKINDKKLFFAKEGQIAWLVSYVADRSKKVKKIY